MGEAKRKNQQKMHFKLHAEPHVAKVASAIQKLAYAASSHQGMDCYLHAALGQALLSRNFGISTDIRVGYAAWRVGDGDGDVISHTKHTTAHLPQGVNGLAYHAWLEANEHIIDLTTYQLTQKGKELDGFDGGRTAVDWCPAFLFVPKNEARSYQEVAQRQKGLFFYEHDAALQASVAGRFELDPDDVDTAEAVLSTEDVVVIGPNQLPQETAPIRQPSTHAAES